MKIENMRVNGSFQPVAIDLDAPVFSWELSADEKGTMQQGYRIIVSKRDGANVVWDSKRAASEVSAGIRYEGEALVPAAAYTWNVEAWTNQGEDPVCSPTAHFRAGLAKKDWSAAYIWDESRQSNSFRYFRKAFFVKKDVKEAVVYVSAHNDYQLFLNNARIGAGPARSDPYSYGQYCAYDVSKFLFQGKNCLASLVHWHGEWKDSGVNAKPAFILELKIVHTDGSSMTMQTDESWKTSHAAPYIESDPVFFGCYGGEKNRASIRYDARLEKSGWNQIDFDDSEWKAAKIVDRSDFNLFAQRVGEQKEMEFHEPRRIEKREGHWYVDFGICLSGWPKLLLHRNMEGDVITIRYWEVMAGWGDAGYDSYIAKGGEEQFYTPYVRHASFRILEITGYQGELAVSDVTGIAAYSCCEKAGSFHCSDSRLNAVYEMSERSGRQNLQQGIISVDANREQSPWLADSWNIGIGYLYNQKDTMAIDKVIRDYAGEQLENGDFLTCSPARDYHSEMIEWSLYWPMLLWEQYLFFGDGTLLSGHYPNLDAFLRFVQQWKNPETGLFNPASWRASDYAGGTIENGGENIVTNCHIYRAFEIGALAARELSMPEEEDSWKTAAKELKEAINHGLLIKGEKYKTAPDKDQVHPLGTAWALRFHIVPEQSREKAICWLAGQKEAYAVGGYGGDALYNGLYLAGLGAVAAEDFARYDQMLQANNTNWESFGELSIDNMGNHAWTAYPAYLLQKYVGGISPTAAGFAAFDVRPVTEGLSFAEASVPTVKGMVRSRWWFDAEGRFHLDVTVPANATARVFLPCGEAGPARVEQVDSGEHHFTV